MTPIKKFILRMKLSLASKASESYERKPVPYSKATHVGILIFLSDTGIKTSVEAFAESILKDGKKLEALCFSERHTFFRFNFPCQYFSLDDMDWKGDFKGELINKFTKTPFDYLYSINILPILPFKYILQQSKAKCRVGKFEEGAGLDLMIQVDKDRGLEFLMDQMKKYSKKIHG